MSFEGKLPTIIKKVIIDFGIFPENKKIENRYQFVAKNIEKYQIKPVLKSM